VFLDRALRAAKLDPATDVQLVNQRMSEAVTSFISGAVPAVALWVPFDTTVKEKVPNAHMLVDASKFFPEAAIMGGWAANNDFYAANQPVLSKVIAAWVEANDAIVNNTAKSVEMLQKDQYDQVPLEQFKQQFSFSKYYSSTEWRGKDADGTVTRGLQQVSDFFVKHGNIQNAVPAETYFNPKLYLDIVKA
jgi:NitT/TauT family transport system substrate-binding protein